MGLAKIHFGFHLIVLSGLFNCVPSPKPAKDAPAPTVAKAKVDDALVNSDCSMSAHLIVPGLVGKISGETVLAPVIRDRRLREAVRLPDGVVLSRMIGGCHHYDVHYTWSPVAQDMATDDPAWPSVALDLLRQTPELRLADTSVHDVFEQALVQAKPPAPHHVDGHVYSLPAGVNICSLVVQRKDNGIQVQLTFDYPL